MELVVQYMVPVSVFVNTETGEVDRVLLEAQNIVLNDSEPVVDTMDWQPVTNNQIVEAATDIAETYDWPVWDRA